MASMDRDSVTALRDVVASALASAAERMDARSLSGQVRIVERDLETSFVAVLRDARATVSPQSRIVLEDWPGVGCVDLALRDDRSTALVELKWGAGTLYNCVWDAAKLASAVARGACDAGYLVAGAPTAEWESAPGAALFLDAEWESAELLSSYRRHWNFWFADVTTHPRRLPARVKTEAIAAQPMRIHGSAWELRCASVRPTDGRWIDVTYPIE